MEDKLGTPRGPKSYKKRAATLEPVFAQIKHNRRSEPPHDEDSAQQTALACRHGDWVRHAPSASAAYQQVGSNHVHLQSTCDDAAS
jgi:hypothetical protein